MDLCGETYVGTVLPAYFMAILVVIWKEGLDDTPGNIMLRGL